MCMLILCAYTICIIKQFYITIHIDASKALHFMQSMLQSKFMEVLSLDSYFEHIAMWYLHRMIQYKNMWLHGVVHTRASVCYLTVGDCCRVFLYAYDIETAVIISCRTSNLLSNAWVLIIHHIFTRIAAYVYFSTPINVGTVIVSFINKLKFQELLKELSCASEAVNPRLQSLWTTTPPCLNFPCRKEVPVSHRWAQFLTSVTSFQNFIINFFLLQQSLSVTLLQIQLLAGGMVS